MGCWNGTCGISHLPILNGEKVVLFPIKRTQYARTNSGGYVYPHDQFAPISIGVHGDYNDYGGIENITKNGDVVFESLMSATDYRGSLLQPIKKELDRHQSLGGKNEKPQDAEELFNEFIERGIYEGIGFMMIRKEIYDTIIDNLDKQKQKYKRDAHSLIDSYQKRMKAVQKEIDGLQEELVEAEGDAYQELLKRDIKKLEFQLTHPKHDFEFEMKCHDNGLARHFFNYSEGKHFMQSSFMAAVMNKDKALLDDFIDLILIELSMYDLRKGWGLQAGAGSQNDDVDLHIELAIHTIDTAVRIKHRYSLDELYENQAKKVEEKLSGIKNYLYMTKSKIQDIHAFIDELMETNEDEEEE